MAKERADSNLSHEERKALRRAEKKEKKRSDTDGVRKVKDKKEKKDKEKKKKKTTTTGERAVLAEKITNPVEDGTVAMVVDKEEKGEEGKGKEGGADEVGKENKEAMKSEGHDDEDEAEAEAETDGENRKKKNTKDGKVMMRPVGALVPFANPLADEKVAKKIFKGVKKGTCVCVWAKVRLAVGWGKKGFSQKNSADVVPFVWGIGDGMTLAYTPFPCVKFVVVHWLFLVGHSADSFTTSFSCPLHSCRIQIPQTRRQRSRQGASKVPYDIFLSSSRYSRLGGRYLTDGCHLAHPGAL